MKQHNDGHDQLKDQMHNEKIDALNSTNFLDFQDKFENDTNQETVPVSVPKSNRIRFENPEESHSMDGAKKALQRTEQLTDELRQQNQLYDGLMTKNWSLGEQLMNRSMFKQVQRMKEEMLATTSINRIKVYDTVLQARLDFIREHCNAALTVVKSTYRLEIAKAFTKHLEELYRTIIARRSSFVQMTLAECQETDVIPNIRLRKMINASIIKGEDMYIDMLDDLLIHYSNILKSLVEKD